jgi:hypothetical protein
MPPLLSSHPQNMRILIVGSFGLPDLGGEAILEEALRRLREALPGSSISVTSRCPAETAARHGVPAVALSDLSALADALAGADLVIWGGDRDGLLALVEREFAESRTAPERTLLDLAAARSEAAGWKADFTNTMEDLEAWQEIAYKTRKEVEAWKASHDHARSVAEAALAEAGRGRPSAERRWPALYRRVRSGLGRRLRRSSTPRVPVAAGAPAAPLQAPESGPENSSTAGGLPSAPGERYDVMVFSIIDWDYRFQRPQQIATQFGRAGHRVFFLSVTSFLRPGDPPGSLVAKAPGVAELAIRSNRALNVYRGQLSEGDIGALENSFHALAEQLSLRGTVVLVQIPFWAPLAIRLRDRLGWRVVYDCMDEWTNFPGIGRQVLGREEELVRAADLTVVSSGLLAEKWRGRSRRLLVARNGVDLDHYRTGYHENDVLGPVSHPVIGYYGALASWVDMELIEKVARRFVHATLVLAGGHFDVDVSTLARYENVRLLGQRPYEEMPRLLWHFDACMIPFLNNAITQATNPVKFYEYCYSGKPVVAPDLVELRPFGDRCYLARNHDEFLRGLEQALAEGPDDPRRERRRETAAANDWIERYRAIDRELATPAAQGR